MKPIAMGGLLALLLFLGVSRGPDEAAAQTPEQQPPPATETAPPPAAEEPSEPVPCSTCHEDQVKAFRGNPHARGHVTKGEVSRDSCETCHGDATEHVETGDKEKIAVPRGLKGSDETCLMCHDVTTERMTRRTGMHSNSQAVNCLTCHSIHHSDPKSPYLVARPQLALCGTCHTQSASVKHKPYGHRLDRGGMTCSTCHEPHGRPAKGSRSLALVDHLRTTRAGEAPCLSCHTEKRGPFVFPHAGNEVADCASCHDPHGSNNPMLLKRATVAQVCIECHSPTAADTLGSQPPSFHNLASPRYQNCTSCHVAVHGSNRDPMLFK